jgi:hypothetical protein
MSQSTETETEPENEVLSACDRHLQTTNECFQMELDLWRRRFAYLRRWCHDHPGDVPLYEVSPEQDRWVDWIATQNQQSRNRTGLFRNDRARVVQWKRLVREYPVLNTLTVRPSSSR